MGYAENVLLSFLGKYSETLSFVIPPIMNKTEKNTPICNEITIMVEGNKPRGKYFWIKYAKIPAIDAENKGFKIQFLRSSFIFTTFNSLRQFKLEVNTLLIIITPKKPVRPKRGTKTNIAPILTNESITLYQNECNC